MCGSVVKHLMVKILIYKGQGDERFAVLLVNERRGHSDFQLDSRIRQGLLCVQVCEEQMRRRAFDKAGCRIVAGNEIVLRFQVKSTAGLYGLASLGERLLVDDSADLFCDHATLQHGGVELLELLRA